MSTDWELWGTFSVSDHLRPDPFAADVLLFDRLAIPAAMPDDVDRWRTIGRRPELQSEVLSVLRDLPGGALYKIPWDDEKRRYFHDNYADPDLSVSTQALTTAVRFDVTNVQEAKRENPDSDGQFQTRLYLRDVLDAENDRKLFAGVPAAKVDVVAAYGSTGEMSSDIDLDDDGSGVSPDDSGLLGAFAWPFLVPAVEGSGLDNLKRCVELANTQHVIDYRAAFHEWRGRVLRADQTPAQATADVRERIDRYAAMMREQHRRTLVKRAFVFTGLTAGLAIPILGLAGLATTGGIAGIVGAGSAAFEPVFGGILRRRSKVGIPSGDIGAQFWQLQQALASTR